MNPLESIRAYVRIKPARSEEAEDVSIEKIDENKVLMKDSNETFEFERVFGMDSVNSKVFEEVIESNWDSLGKGIKMAVFTYGQTSSGKTHTMKGDSLDPGLIPRCLMKVFDTSLDASSKKSMIAKMSYYEIYNESINDLLDGSRKNMDIREDKETGVFVKDLTQVEVTDIKSAMGYFEKGEAERTYASTEANNKSSRSHVILQLDIEVRHHKAPLRPVFASITLADLAGSECLGNTKTKGKNVREGGMINKSLLSLSNVIFKLSKRDEFVGYRESKLTRILQPVLTGNCLTSVVCTVNALRQSVQETVNTLKFGTCAGVVKKKVEMQVERPGQDSRAVKEVVVELDSMACKVEEARNLLFEKETEIINLRTELEDAMQTVKVSEKQRALLEREVERLAAENKDIKSDNEKLTLLMEDVEAQVTYQKEIEFKYMFDQQTVLIRNLEEEIERLKKEKDSGKVGDIRKPRELIPCMKRPFGLSSNANCENGGIESRGESMVPESEGRSGSWGRENPGKRSFEQVYEKMKAEVELQKDKARDAQKELIKVEKVNHTLRLEIESLARQVKEIGMFNELPRVRKKPVYTTSFDRHGDRIEKRVNCSPSKEELKRKTQHMEKRLVFFETKLEESQSREDFFMRKMKDIVNRNEVLEEKEHLYKELQIEEYRKAAELSQKNSDEKPILNIESV